jgi:hypothetical protein
MKSYLAVLAVVLLAGAIPTHSQTLDDQEKCASQARKAFQEWENDTKKAGAMPCRSNVRSQRAGELEFIGWAKLSYGSKR